MNKPPFLKVTRSALQRAWVDRLDAEAARRAEAIADIHGLPNTLARILAGRGAEVTNTLDFLEPRVKSAMPDPLVMIDAERAIARLADAIASREPIAIFGDYDVDGACSAALLGGYLRHFGLRPLIHIPDRLTEGYGPNSEAIRGLKAEGASLLVCVDCGTSGHAPLAEAKALGMDVIVLDHHQAPVDLPAIDALVNPNRQDDLSGLGHLCAAGVVFLVLAGLSRALRERGLAGPDLLSQLDVVALATVADVVPLTGLNRAYVAQGLKVMKNRERIGLAALADVARLDSAPEAWHLGYLLGPRINAGGRIGDAALGARLLLSDNPEEAMRIAQSLDGLNRERQAVEEAMLLEAEAQALQALGLAEEDREVLVVAGEGWHPGIVGIIAGRLKERFRRPAFAIAAYEGAITGSGRSIAGVDLGAAVRAAVEAGMALKGGGHLMAAGVTLPPGGVAAFADFLEERLAPSVRIARAEDALAIDAALSAESLTPDFVTAISRAGPFGSGNPEPVFALPSHRVAEVMELKGGHLKANLVSTGGTRIEAMAFRAAGKPLGDALLVARGEMVHAAGTASLDQWGGRLKVSFRLVDLARS
ncbi:MAG: single-stranded-DNA-specific exonuclease RecJ [Methylobacterium sp.]|nr:single-stranded-DNA-specific exonuclease RecJ [Methylobacterium sp.]MCA3609754.1 single-stranded-DNA-specific exonuclease RecJ [Methylobacterium sp.]MCA3616988.1 single-stranded-DNA-specific exonuclease RecJ [Methylobacterium sp.]MCA3622068.1 single-stranded-DNA-specific exonuclease RecJ [Methylobacterium sp.]